MGGLFVGYFHAHRGGRRGRLRDHRSSPLVGRNLTWKGFVQALDETTRISCMIMVIVAGATIFGHFLAVTRIPFDIGALGARARRSRRA